MITAENDAMSVVGLSMTLQRIGLSHWSAEAVLRSWGIAPILVANDRVAAPCGVDEAIWIGFWLDGEAESATVSVTDMMTGTRACKRWPESSQLASLSNGAPQPIRRSRGESERTFAVEVVLAGGPGGVVRSQFPLSLLEPEAWAKESGRPAPLKLSGPPPLPPLLG